MSKKIKVDKFNVAILACVWVATALTGSILLKNNWHFVYLLALYGMLLAVYFVLWLFKPNRLIETLFYNLMWSAIVGGLVLFFFLQWFSGRWGRGFV